MKNEITRKIKSKSGITNFIILSILIVFLFLRCSQEAIQPEIVNIRTNMSIFVVDQSGKPVPGANVTIYKLKPRQFYLSNSTDPNGKIILKDYFVPIIGEIIEVTITPPPGVNAQPITDTLSLPCRDAEFTLIIEIREDVTCNSTSSGSLQFSTCVGKSDTLSSNYVYHDCPCDLTISLTQSSPSPDLQVSVVPAQGQNINNSTALKVTAIFNPKREGTINNDVTVTASGTCGSFTYILSIKAVGVECFSCQCPTLPDTIKNNILDTVCVGTSKEIQVDLSKVVNNTEASKNCVLEFQRIKSFFNSNILQITGEPRSLLGGGRSLPPLTVRVSPTKRGLIIDSVQYSVRIRNNDSVKDCGFLNIKLSVFAGQGICKIDSNANDNSLITTNNQIDQCVGLDLITKKILIRNIGECPLDILGTMNNNIFYIDPESNIINPGQVKTFTIHFVPKISDVWPNGRGKAPGITRFNAMLNICGFNIPVVGIVDTNCYHPNYDCFKQYDINNQWRQAVVFNRKTNEITKGNPVVAPNRDLFFPQINVAGGSCTLESDWASFGRPPSPFNTRNRSSQTDNPCNWVVDYTPLIYSSGLISWQPTRIDGVRVNDVILFSITYVGSSEPFYGIIWINDIKYDTQVNGLPIVCYDICFPI